MFLQHDIKGNTETWNPVAAPSMEIMMTEHSGGRKQEGDNKNYPQLYS